MKKTSCYVIALSFLTAVFFVMVSCNKDSVKVSGFGLQDYLDNNMTKSEVGLVIGKFTPDGNESEHCFNQCTKLVGSSSAVRY